MKAMFPGMMCVAKSCRSNEGREIIPGQDIEVHPSIRGPQGGKKYTHSECMARSNPSRRPKKRTLKARPVRKKATVKRRTTRMRKNPSTSAKLKAVARKYGKNSPGGKLALQIAREME